MDQINDEPALTLGERLRHRRWTELRIKLQDVARAVSLSEAQPSEIEHGHVGTTEPVLRRLAAALGINADDLIAQAEREGQVWHRRASRGQPDAPVPSAPLPPDPARAARRPMPTTGWVTAREAAAILGCVTISVYHMIRKGRLTPVKRVQVGGRGHPRWLISAKALASYEDTPYVGLRRPERAQEPPPGYHSVDAAAARLDLTKPTLYRRIAAGEVESLKVNGRRWVRILE